MERYDAWLIDLDGTLYEARWVKLAMAAELAVGGWSAIRTLRSFRGMHERLRELAEDHESPYHAQIQRTASDLGITSAEVERRVEEWMFRRPGKWIRMFRRHALVSEITIFRGEGGRTALVSDYPARTKLAALGVPELFDAIVASGEPEGPRRLKPHPEGYLAAARRLAVSPERCLVLGDREDADGAAALAAGMAFRLIR
jgi:HAD superfamily hydrolase (TIGR01549 family)